nr:immunoglobulin light chain junction region [Macaca mulatta]MPO09716.1 immunoglobulin light chain junction region [Macaca mulatta]MPO14146.1 immunoglobulin light chain junction region [Macaca mulatta]
CAAWDSSLSTRLF